MTQTLILSILLLSSWSSCAHASTLLPRQNQDSDYPTCAQGCFVPALNAADCPFDTSGTRNACLCSSTSFLTNFMTCTFQDCGGQILAEAAETAVENCDTTNTPSVYNADQLVSIGQSGDSSTTASAIATTATPEPAAASSTPSSNPSTDPTPTPAATSTSTSTSTAAPKPSSSSSDNSGGGGGLDTSTIIAIVSGAVGAIGVISGIIFGIHQWRTRAPGDRAVRDVGSWFCGCGSRHRRVEEPRPQPHVQYYGYP